MKKKSIVLLLALSLLSSSVVYAGEDESNVISSEVEQFSDQQTNVEETAEELETQESQQILEQQEQSQQDVSNQENEEELQRAIAELTHDKTIIMIAHRLKTVRGADQILVLDDSHIVQSGTHAELIQQKGLYADFVSARQEAIGWKLAQ